MFHPIQRRMVALLQSTVLVDNLAIACAHDRQMDGFRKLQRVREYLVLAYVSASEVAA